jgi:hypothetical protein
MYRKWRASVTGACATGACVVGVFLCCAQARADFESQLLQKFKNDNQAATAKLKQELEGLLTQAATYRTSAPEQSVQLLQKCLPLLQEDHLLTNDDRTTYLRKVDDGLKQARAVLASRVKTEEKQLPPAPEDVTAAAWPRWGRSPDLPGSAGNSRNSPHKGEISPKTSVSPPIFAAVPTPQCRRARSCRPMRLCCPIAAGCASA